MHIPSFSYCSKVAAFAEFASFSGLASFWELANVARIGSFSGLVRPALFCQTCKLRRILRLSDAFMILIWELRWSRNPPRHPSPLQSANHCDRWRIHAIEQWLHLRAKFPLGQLNGMAACITACWSHIPEQNSSIVLSQPSSLWLVKHFAEVLRTPVLSGSSFCRLWRLWDRNSDITVLSEVWLLMTLCPKAVWVIILGAFLLGVPSVLCQLSLAPGSILPGIVSSGQLLLNFTFVSWSTAFNRTFVYPAGDGLWDLLELPNCIMEQESHIFVQQDLLILYCQCRLLFTYISYILNLVGLSQCRHPLCGWQE